MESRIRELRKKMLDWGLTYFLVLAFYPRDFNIEHLFYLTGVIANGLVLITPDKVYLFTGGPDFEAAKDKAKVEVILVKENYFEALKKSGLIKKGEAVGVESDRLVEDDFRWLANRYFPENKFVSLRGIISSIAAFKDRGEINKIQRVLSLTEHVVKEHILPMIRPGISELELHAQFNLESIRHGLKIDFARFLSGPRSSQPHGATSHKIIEKGDLLLFDVGCDLEGYYSDFCRTLVVGAKPTSEQREVYRIVRQALEKAIKMMRPGLIIVEWVKEVEETMSQTKYKDYRFQSNLGHGIGLWVHQSPRLDSSSAGFLMEGMVIAVEPSINIPGWGGVMIEDTVVVTKNGHRVLNKFPRGLLVVGQE